MTFTLPNYCRILPAELDQAELLATTADDCTYRLGEFDGLTAHEKLLKKLAIMAERGTYQLTN